MERILSYLILRAFPLSAGGQDVDHLTSRMQAINYLGSLMSQNIAPIPDNTFLKCLSLTLDHYSAKHNNDPNEDNHNSKIFTHCFVGNLALIFSSRPEKIKVNDEKTYFRLTSILFSKKWNSLEYTSPSTLH